MSTKRLAPLLLACAIGLAGCMDRVTEHRVRGNAHFREGDYAGAIAEYDQGLAVKPNDAATLILKGNALFELKKYDESYAVFQRAYSTDTSAADALRGMALVSTTKGDLADASVQFERLLGLKSHEHDTATRVNLAKLYLAQNKVDDAEKQAEAAGHENGNDEQVLFTLGRVYLVKGKLDEATATFRHLIESNPNKASGYYGLAYVAAKKGDKAEMLKSLGDAIAKGIPDPAAVVKDPAFAAFKDDPQFVAAATPQGK